MSAKKSGFDEGVEATTRKDAGIAMRLEFRWGMPRLQEMIREAILKENGVN